MCLTEYNETETMEMLRQEGRQEGLQEGRQEGRQEGLQEGRQEGLQEGRQETMLSNIKNLTESTGLTTEKAMDLLKIPLSQRTAFYTKLSKKIVK